MAADDGTGRSDEFRLTHAFLGHMLGVRRVGVTMAARALQKRKLIAYTAATSRSSTVEAS